MATDAATVREYGFAKTQRRDAWWAGPLVTVLVLGGFVIYTTFRIFQNAYFQLGHGTDVLPEHSYMLSPMYSPLLALPTWVPTWISPAMFILWMPGGFRLTCYYYRKAYYRAFMLDPPGCAVGEPRNEYAGETRLLVFQNIHRYFLYIALVFIVILGYDAIHAFIWPTADGGSTFGISVGSLVLTAGDRAARAVHDSAATRCGTWWAGTSIASRAYAAGRRATSCGRASRVLNENHMFWAWTSLFGVTLADFYVWMVASGRIRDLELFVLR